MCCCSATTIHLLLIYRAYICIISALVALQYTWQSIPALFDTLVFRVTYPPLPLASACLLSSSIGWNGIHRIDFTPTVRVVHHHQAKRGLLHGTRYDLKSESRWSYLTLSRFDLPKCPMPPSALPLIRWKRIHWIYFIYVLQSGWSSIYWSTALPLLVHY